MRLFDPPFIPEVLNLLPGGLLTRENMPILAQRVVLTKASSVMNGDILKQATEMAKEQLPKV